MRILSIFGTRPEAIKMAPVVRLLGECDGQVESLVCVTAQHREILDQVLRLFEITPDIDLDLMEENQDLASLTSRAVRSLSEVLERTRPSLVLVQGDTTTAMAAGLAAFYRRIPVGHVEAGLRTYDRLNPFPEEVNRRVLSALASCHFAPTERAAAALRNEGVAKGDIHVTGNPVIDSLLWIRGRAPSPAAQHFLASLDLRQEEGQAGPRRTILVTAHRRESFGEPLENICRALRRLVERNPDVHLAYPVHPNPNVQGPVFRLLSGEPRIHLIEPLPYDALVHLMARCYLVMTDSGGLQEEAPALGKPVLVLREETERPEGVEAGTAKVVGTAPEVIVEESERLLRNPRAYRQMAAAVSPYGDGRAAERIVRIIRERIADWLSQAVPAP